MANHIYDDELQAYLVIRRHKRWTPARSPDIALHALSVISGHTPLDLAHALPDIRPQLADQSALQVIGRTTVNGPNRTRPACRRCMAAKGITGNPLKPWRLRIVGSCWSERRASLGGQDSGLPALSPVQGPQRSPGSRAARRVVARSAMRSTLEAGGAAP
jgi:hypothetical protein